METYKQKFTKLQNEIFNLLCFKAGEKLNQRMIAKFLKVSPTAIKKVLPLLEKEGLIKLEKGKNINLNLVSLNQDSKRTIELKRIENLKNIYESRLVDFLEEKFHGCAIILFGSYSRGEDTITSDIDIAIIGTKGKEIDLSIFEKKLEKAIRVNFYHSFNDIHLHLKSNIFNGIVLAGAIQL